MTNLPSEAVPAGAQTYRLVVSASHLKAKQFVWVIVDDTNRGTPVQASNRSFQSLEDAYNAGQGALKYWRDKATRAQAKALLVAPTTPKDRPKRPTRIRSR
jgi:hypothetical protein